MVDIALDPDESVRGFVLRLSERIHFFSPRELLIELGVEGGPRLEPRSLMALAEIAGCDLTQLQRQYMSPFRDSGGCVAYRYGLHTISKQYFVESSVTRVCVDCLAASSFLRATWEFTLVVACPIHGRDLIDVCPHCEQPLVWDRYAVSRCECSFDLRRAEPPDSSDIGNFYSSLIASVLSQSAIVDLPAVLPSVMVNRLLALTPDGLMKKIWYLGRYLALPLVTVRGHVGQQHPNVAKAKAIVVAAHEQLMNWPVGYLKVLDELAGRPQRKIQLGKCERMFGPIHRYLTQEMDRTELRFIHAAYEQGIRTLWRDVRSKRVPSVVTRQGELDLD